MSNWRSQKRQARRDIHREMGVPALLLPNGQGTGIPIIIRGPHTKRPISVGDLAGGGEGWAERVDVAPRIVFWRSHLEAPLRQGDVISVEAGEGYRIARVEPPYDQTVTAEVTPLSAAATASLPVPTDAATPPLDPALPTPPNWAQIFRDREAANGDD